MATPGPKHWNWRGGVSMRSEHRNAIARRTRARRIDTIGLEAEARRQLNAYLKHAYGVSLEWYEDTLEKQCGGCAICGKTPRKRRLSVDHEHRTGRVRGLLCQPCNLMIGLIETRPQLLSSAQDYLARYSPKGDHPWH